MGLRNADLGTMPGNISYRFTHEGVENPVQTAMLALDKILLGKMRRIGLRRCSDGRLDAAGLGYRLCQLPRLDTTTAVCRAQ